VRSSSVSFLATVVVVNGQSVDSVGEPSLYDIIVGDDGELSLEEADVLRASLNPDFAIPIVLRQAVTFFFTLEDATLEDVEQITWTVVQETEDREEIVVATYTGEDNPREKEHEPIDNHTLLYRSGL